jgi:uncharacterized protein YcbK (DUF882 family)
MMTTQNRLRLVDLFKYYKELPHQTAAIFELEEALLKAAPDLLNRDQAWFKTWSQAGRQTKFENTWEGVMSAAKNAGAKFPQLVAAQWAVESGWGKHTSGENNFFGLKGSGSTKSTKEFINGTWITINDSFLDFPDLETCVFYLVERWYKDFKTYQGCNRATTPEDAARWLIKEGYATDPQYAEKLIKVMQGQGEKAKPAAPASDRFTPDKPFSYKVTKHITYGELALHAPERRFTAQHQCNTALELCKYLEKLREHFDGRALIITSAYRPPAINNAVGGARNSEHLYNTPETGAVDFWVKDMDIYKVQEYCDRTWPYSVGYGAPRGFVHLGMRQGKPRIRWDY